VERGGRGRSKKRVNVVVGKENAEVINWRGVRGRRAANVRKSGWGGGRGGRSGDGRSCDGDVAL
jgi:hypothetical protein